MSKNLTNTMQTNALRPLTLLMLVLVLFIVGCDRKVESDNSSQVAVSPSANSKESQTTPELAPVPPAPQDTVKPFEDPAVKKATEKTKPLPKMVDLGADKCRPCKLMAPILVELRKEYVGKVDVVFIDVWKDPEPGKQAGIRVIPTQIFYNSEGKELFRHEGYFSKEDILAKWREFGFI